MSKEAKLLFISLLLMVLGVGLLYWTQNYECTTVEYQDLQGTHSKTDCHVKPPVTCWSKYQTEELAIQMCEGENK